MIDKMMMLDADLGTTAQLKRWQEEFEKAYNKPMNDMMKAELWAGVPEDMKAFVRKSVPKAAKSFDKLLDNQGA
jgi:hypothetical protein